jgi:hypothetical protein
MKCDDMTVITVETSPPSNNLILYHLLKLDTGHADITTDKFISLKFVQFRSYISPVMRMENTNQFYTFVSISLEHSPSEEINSSSAMKEIP